MADMIMADLPGCKKEKLREQKAMDITFNLFFSLFS